MEPKTTHHEPLRSIRAWIVFGIMWRLVRSKRAALSVGIGLMILNRMAGLVWAYLTKYLVDTVIVGRRFGLLTWFISMMFSAIAVQSLSSFALTRVFCISEEFVTDLRQRVRAHVSRLPARFYDSTQTGIIVERILNDIDSVRNLLSTQMFEFAGAFLTAVVALFILFRINHLMALLAVGVLVFFAVGLRKGWRTLNPIYGNVHSARAQLAGRLTESVGGIRVVKTYNAEEREDEIFADDSRQLLLHNVRSLLVTSTISLFSIALWGGLTTFTMYVGVHQIMKGTLTIGGLFTYIWILTWLDWPISQVVTSGPNLTRSFTGLQRTSELLSEPPEDCGASQTVRLRDRMLGRVEFENVVFSYDGVQPVLNDVSFVCEPGTVTAIVGSSGAGKSTIIGLISAFYSPTSGRILLDDVDLKTLQVPSYREQLGVVLQEPLLFSGTIRDNIAFSRPFADLESIRKVAKVARVDEFVATFALGYETVVGERGAKLSCGQRQRICIARAILRDPRILILDEATSSLDSETEAAIQHALSSVMEGRTTIVIAHRLSTVVHADSILVLEQGRVVERGTHGELYDLRGRYYELCVSQGGWQEVGSNIGLSG